MDDKKISTRDDEIIIEFVEQSPNRKKIVKALSRGKRKPSEISVETGIHINNVSRSLKQLREKEIVFLRNPEAKRGRLYQLTEDGERIAKKIK